MATIQNQFLSILVNQSTEQATVVVDAQVTFGPNELALASRLDCRILGDDPLIDDFLFSFPTHFFFDAGAAQSARFERDDIPRSLLNEDIIGADEIVGELTLKLSTGASISKRTNVFQLR
ncbi:MAG TPA: hypothetical protein VGV87_12730 [Blastocatellia bacterium]|jgi:hypothetical protein|nr:hypothetical protein [Blastocatellia bacterium]